MLNEVIRVGLDDWCPCKKRKLGHRYTQTEDYVKIQGKDSQGERFSKATNPADPSTSDFQPPINIYYLSLRLWYSPRKPIKTSKCFSP